MGYMKPCFKKINCMVVLDFNPSIWEGEAGERGGGGGGDSFGGGG